MKELFRVSLIYGRTGQAKRRFLMGLGCVLALEAALRTVLPMTGYTQAALPLCGKEEHVHSDDCGASRGLVCGLGEAGELSCPLETHCHSELCRDREGNLICGRADFVIHHHDALCYDSAGNLVCTLPEISPHTHSESCYSMETALICGYEEGEQQTVHVHTDSCYTEETGYVCGCEEGGITLHTHDDTCYSLEKTLVCALPEDETHTHGDGCYSEERVLVCGLPTESIHTHTESCMGILRVPVCTEPETRPHVHTGDCYGEIPGTLLCGREEIIPHDHSPDCFSRQPVCGLEHDHGEDCFALVPVCGRVEIGQHQHTQECLLPDSGHIHTDACFETVYACNLEEHSHTAECFPDESADQETLTDWEKREYDLEYETDTLLLRVHLSVPASQEEATMPEVSPAENSESPEKGLLSLSRDNESGEETQESGQTSGELTMTVTPLEETSADYIRLEDYVREKLTEDPFALEALRIQFFAGEQAVDTANCVITARISPKTALLDAGLELAQRENPAEEAELGVAFTVLEVQDTAVTAGEEAVMLAQDSQAPTLTAAVGGDGVVALAAVTANPHFTVQYYAYIDTVNTSGSVGLPIIDTDNGGTCQGGILPQNGVTPKTRQLFLENLSGSVFQAATNKNTVTPVYRERDYEYIHAPNLTYFNRLYENGNYTLSQVWVLNPGKNPASTEKADWTVYTDPGSLHFTNRAQSAQEDSMVLIENDAVIRLVFHTTTGSYTNAATFYDYDITDGLFYRSASVSGGTYDTQSDAGSSPVYAYTNRQGINSVGNYSGSGGKLAYGNSNTGSGLENETWGGSKLNQFNTGTYKGCTFGIAAGLDGNGHIRYASGIDAPSLFNESTATGKTAYTGMGLTFRRDGDTYTLSRVNGSADNLDRFTHVTSYASGLACDIYTNFFWPMDSVSGFGSPGHDLKFGRYALRNQRRFFGAGTGSFPTVDENITNDRDHNCYFGMQYLVRFELTQDYIGPLEYYFFGDDDMWVFLDGRLVCDIGGVHSSVGEYVNLWDWLEKGDAGSHTLSFYYTERGASGSSCYMRFTLPSVSSVTPEQNTGTLRVEKEVAGPTREDDQDREFTFRIFFTDQAGNKLKDDYAYTRYDREGNIVKKDLILYDGGSFRLRDGEYIIVKYLPLGAKYRVSEEETDYITTVSINGAGAASTREASGSITKTKEDSIHYVNALEELFPQTGGEGTGLYLMAGALLMALPAGLERGRRGRERRVRETPP